MYVCMYVCVCICIHVSLTGHSICKATQVTQRSEHAESGMSMCMLCICMYVCM